MVIRTITFYHPYISDEINRTVDSVNSSNKTDWWEVAKGVGLVIAGVALIMTCAVSSTVTAGGAVAGVITGSGFLSVGVSKVIAEFTK